MYSLLSVLLTKEPATCDVNLYRANSKTVGTLLRTRVKGCGAYVQCIADLDNAQFVTKFEMMKLCEQILHISIPGVPLDRLVAAKRLSLAISERHSSLPLADEALTVEEKTNSKCFMPQAKIEPPRLGTKSAMQLALLQKGTTLSEMARVLGWQVSSVYSGLNYDLNHTRGFGYKVEKRTDQEDLYTLIVPDWYSGPLFLPARVKKAGATPVLSQAVPLLLQEEEIQYA